MSIELYPHQLAAVKAAKDAINAGQRRGLWAMPTGSGKTVAFASLAAELDRPTLVLVHRRELLRQTVEAFAQAWPAAQVATLPGEAWEGSHVLVATVQSLHSKLGKLAPGRFGLVVVDEAHHTPASTWRKVLDHLAPLFALGCTATPDRLDRQDVVGLFDELIYEYELGQAMEDGVILPIRQHGIFTETDLAGVGVRGDFTARELGAAVRQAERNEVVVRAYLAHAKGRPALVFAADLEHVRQLDEELRAAGVESAAVTGEMSVSERAGTLERFRKGELQALVCCQVLTEGYDEARVACVVMARPTASQALYYQCVGRGLRTDRASGKTDCLVLDVIDRGARKHPVVASDLFGARVHDCGGGDVRDAALEEQGRWAVYPVSPGAPLEADWLAGEETPWEELPNLEGYAPSRPWHSQPATNKQKRKLTVFYRMEIHRTLTLGEADYLIKDCRELEDEYPTPATPGQQRQLRPHGLWRPGMTKHEAMRRAGWLSSTRA